MRAVPALSYEQKLHFATAADVATEADAARIARAARAYSVRRAVAPAMRAAKLGQHFRLQLPSGRSRQLWQGDEIVVAYADRYAPSQFEAHVPADLGPCNLAASGGIAARVIATNGKLGKRPTELEPIGLICPGADAPALNVADFALANLPPAARLTTTIAVVGSAMDSGKTSALAHLAKGVSRLGVRVGYAKLTGTAAGGDPWLLVDAGADPVLDFTDLGFASTSRTPVPTLERVCEQLVLRLQHAGAEVALLEIADGLFQPETAALLASAKLRGLVDGMLYASVDALGAAHGASLLFAQGHRLLGLTGMLATAPLLVREAQAATDLPVYDRSDLADASVAAKLLAAHARRPAGLSARARATTSRSNTSADAPRRRLRMRHCSSWCTATRATRRSSWSASRRSAKRLAWCSQRRNSTRSASRTTSASAAAAPAPTARSTPCSRSCARRSACCSGASRCSASPAAASSCIAP
jgi:hypothetical protein